MTFSVPSNPSPQLKVVLDFFDALASYNIRAFAPILSDDYEHEIAPLSLGYAAVNKEGLLDRIEGKVWPLIKNAKFTHQHIVETADTVVVHTKTTEPTVGAFTKTPYSNEIIFIFTLQKVSDGLYQLLHTLEFLDSHYTSTFVRAEREAAEKAEAKLS